MRNSGFFFTLFLFGMVLFSDWVHNGLAMAGFGAAFLLACVVWSSKGGRP